MQTKHLSVLIYIWTKGEVGAPLNRFKSSSKIFYWPFQGGTSFVDLLCCFCLVFAMPLYEFVYMWLWFTCWERAYTLALVCGVLLWVCYFPIGILGQVWYLIYRFLICASVPTWSCCPFYSRVMGRWFCVVTFFQWSDRKVVLCGCLFQWSDRKMVLCGCPISVEWSEGGFVCLPIFSRVIEGGFVWLCFFQWSNLKVVKFGCLFSVEWSESGFCAVAFTLSPFYILIYMF